MRELSSREVSDLPKVTQPGNDRTRIRIQARGDRVGHSNPSKPSRVDRGHPCARQGGIEDLVTNVSQPLSMSHSVLVGVSNSTMGHFP